MSDVDFHKVVSALPAVLMPDSIYYVRRGNGFDQYVTNSLGVIVAYPLNLPQPNENKIGVRFYDAEGTRHYLKLNEQLELPITLSNGVVSSVPTLGVLHG